MKQINGVELTQAKNFFRAIRDNTKGIDRVYLQDEGNGELHNYITIILQALDNYDELQYEINRLHRIIKEIDNENT